MTIQMMMNRRSRPCRHVADVWERAGRGGSSTSASSSIGAGKQFSGSGEGEARASSPSAGSVGMARDVGSDRTEDVGGACEQFG